MKPIGTITLGEANYAPETGYAKNTNAVQTGNRNRLATKLKKIRSSKSSMHGSKEYKSLRKPATTPGTEAAAGVENKLARRALSSGHRAQYPGVDRS